MLNSKLVITLLALGPEDHKELDLFLRSPYFNRAKEAPKVLALFKFCLRYCHKPSPKEFTKEAAFQACYPDAPWVEGKLDKLMTKLNQLIAHYMTIKPLQVDWLAQAAFYREQNLPQFAEPALAKAAAVLGEKTSFDTAFYHQQYLLNKEQAALHEQLWPQKENPIFSEALRSLDVYYLTAKLELAYKVCSRQLHSKMAITDIGKASLAWLDAILPQAAHTSVFDIPTIRIYRDAYILLRNYDTVSIDQVHQLEQALAIEGQQLPFFELKSIHTILRIYAVGKYNQGDEAYKETAFRLYQFHLAKGWLYYDGKLSPETVLNIVRLGLRNNQKEWVHEFLKEHQHRIAGNYPPLECYHFNMAIYHFHCKEFDKAEQLLGQDFQNLFYKVGARRLEVMVLFEQKSVLLTAKVEAFKMFIFRLSKQLLPDKHKQLNNHFIDILRQIMLPATLGNAKRIAKIKAKLKQETPIAEREWLLEKLGGMK